MIILVFLNIKFYYYEKNIDVEGNLIKIEGIFKQHIKNCIKPPDSCVCSTLLEKSIKRNIFKIKIYY